MPVRRASMNDPGVNCWNHLRDEHASAESPCLKYPRNYSMMNHRCPWFANTSPCSLLANGLSDEAVTLHTPGYTYLVEMHSTAWKIGHSVSMDALKDNLLTMQKSGGMKELLGVAMGGESHVRMLLTRHADCVIKGFPGGPLYPASRILSYFLERPIGNLGEVQEHLRILDKEPSHQRGTHASAATDSASHDDYCEHYRPVCRPSCKPR
jgi:hypothetical protein